MKQRSVVSTTLLMALLITTALLSSSCDSGAGMAMGVGAPTRWGSGGSGPPVFVGGPGGF